MYKKKVFICADAPLLYRKIVEKQGNRMATSIKDADEFWLMEDIITRKMSEEIMQAYKLHKSIRTIHGNIAAKS